MLIATRRQLGNGIVSRPHCYRTPGIDDRPATQEHRTMPPPPALESASVKPRCAICYTTDPAYLFPTFVSAMQARRHTSPGKADILLFSFGAQAAAERVFERACQAEGIRFIRTSTAVIDGAAVMLARLFLSRFVPDEYEQFLYMDGDTQVRGSLDPLLDAEVLPGQFMAANDPMTFALPGRDSHSRDIANHFESIGISVSEKYNYFNTGVLRINRSGWEEIGIEAWRLFVRNAGKSRFPDQDVLNIAGGSRRIPMSLAWNFPIYMLNVDVEKDIAPRVYHFMSDPKPWQGVFQPWGSDGRLPYIEIVRKYPDLLPYWSLMPARTRVRYHLQQRYKKFTETFTWRLSPKRGRILSYERGLASVDSSFAS